MAKDNENTFKTTRYSSKTFRQILEIQDLKPWDWNTIVAVAVDVLHSRMIEEIEIKKEEGYTPSITHQS